MSDWKSIARMVQSTVVSQLEAQLNMFVAKIESQEKEIAELKQQLQRAGAQPGGRANSSSGSRSSPARASSAASALPAASMPAAALSHAASAAAASGALTNAAMEVAASNSQQQQAMMLELMDEGEETDTAGSRSHAPPKASVPPVASTPPPAAASARKKRAASPTPIEVDSHVSAAVAPAAVAAPASKRARVTHISPAAAPAPAPPTAALLQAETQTLPPAAHAALHTAAVSHEASPLHAGYGGSGGIVPASIPPPAPSVELIEPAPVVVQTSQPVALVEKAVVVPAAPSARAVSPARHSSPARSSSRQLAPVEPIVPASPRHAPRPATPSTPGGSSRPSALALVSAAFPSSAAALAVAAQQAPTPSLPLLPPSQAPLPPDVFEQAESLVKAGGELSMRSDWEGALSKFSEGIGLISAIDWRYVQASWLKQRSTVHAKLAHNALAFADAHRMVSLHPRDWTGYYTLSTLLGRDKNYSQALAECRKAWKCVAKRSETRKQVEEMRRAAAASAAAAVTDGAAPLSPPSSSPQSSAHIERFEREAEADRKKVAERVKQLEQKLHMQPSVLDFEMDAPEEEEAPAQQQQQQQKDAPATTAEEKQQKQRSPQQKPHTAPPGSPKSPARNHGAAPTSALAPVSPGKVLASSSPSSSQILPLLTFGTYKLTGARCQEYVLAALGAGFRRIDTGASYANEEFVGRALVASGLKREQVHLTTKLSWNDLTSADAAYTAGLESVKKLGVACVDLILIHHPGRAKLPPSSPLHASSRAAAWKGLERLVSEGRTRKIGVSNFEIKHVEQILSLCKVQPATNQIEMHPLMYAHQKPLVEMCQARGIGIQAYSPLGGGNKALLAHPLVISIARATRRSPAEVLLRWSMQHGFIPLVKASPGHVRADIAIAADPPPFTLSEEQMHTLDQMGQGADMQRFAWDPTPYA